MLHQLDDLSCATVVKRPSASIKSPYVADISIQGDNALAHSPSLGCCGLADAGASVFVQKSKKDTTKTGYTVYLSLHQEVKNGITCESIVGIHPKTAELLVENALKGGFLSKLQNVKSYKRETTIKVVGKVDSRFDFSGIDCNGIPFLMEVKNVPLADYEDLCLKERKKMDFSDREFGSKVAYFPDGYRKKSLDPISPRAIKHIKELTLIKCESKVRCIMCYVIQRTDVDRFTASVIDPEYKSAFNNAILCGVEIITMVVKWNGNGCAEFVRDDLPIC